MQTGFVQLCFACSRSATLWTIVYLLSVFDGHFARANLFYSICFGSYCVMAYSVGLCISVCHFSVSSNFGVVLLSSGSGAPLLYSCFDIVGTVFRRALFWSPDVCLTLHRIVTVSYISWMTAAFCQLWFSRTFFVCQAFTARLGRTRVLLHLDLVTSLVILSALWPSCFGVRLLSLFRKVCVPFAGIKYVVLWSNCRVILQIEILHKIICFWVYHWIKIYWLYDDKTATGC